MLPMILTGWFGSCRKSDVVSSIYGVGSANLKYPLASKSAATKSCSVWGNSLAHCDVVSDVNGMTTIDMRSTVCVSTRSVYVGG